MLRDGYEDHLYLRTQHTYCHITRSGRCKNEILHTKLKYNGPTKNNKQSDNFLNKNKAF